jgi:hypothetical protein
MKSSILTLSNAVDWLTYIPQQASPTLLFYHVDTDGVSAAYWTPDGSLERKKRSWRKGEME